MGGSRMRGDRAVPRRDESHSCAPPSPVRPSVSPRRWGKMPSRILVVDDDARVARTLVDVLSHHGHELARAETGEEALATLAASPFDLVLLDVRLPGMTGLETCARIRERYGPALPVLMLTGESDENLVREGY